MKYFKVSDEIIDKYGESIGPLGISIFIALVRRCNKQGVCFPSIEKIKKDTGIRSDNTVRKHLKNLLVSGLIRRRLRPAKKYSRYEYQILLVVPSINEYRYPQKMSTKEYPMKEYLNKERHLIKEKRGKHKPLGVNYLYDRFDLNNKA